MRFIVDQPISPIVAEWLRSVNHDAFHLRERELSRLPDTAIFNLAQAEQRIIITSDLDFSRIVALSGRSGPGVILFRAGNITDLQMLMLLKATLDQLAPEDLETSIITVERHRIRAARLPLKP